MPKVPQELLVIPEFCAAYDVVEHLGYGTYGNAYKVREKGTDRLLCAKVVTLWTRDDDQRAKQHAVTTREYQHLIAVKNLSDLVHLDPAVPANVRAGAKYISHIHKYFISRDHTVSLFVTDLGPGGTLQRMMKEIEKYSDANIRERLARRICTQLTLALCFLEYCKVMHNDIKPENIVMTSTDPWTAEIRLIDFGLAKNYEQSATTSNSYGTLTYMAPERFDINIGQKSDIRSELWAVSCIAYEIVTGKPAVPPNHDLHYTRFPKLLLTPLSWPPPDRCAVSSELKDFVAQCRRFDGLQVTNRDGSQKRVFDITKRITVTTAVNHPWLRQVADMNQYSIVAGSVHGDTEEEAATRSQFAAFEAEAKRSTMYGSAMVARNSIESSDEENDDEEDVSPPPAEAAAAPSAPSVPPVEAVPPSPAATEHVAPQPVPAPVRRELPPPLPAAHYATAAPTPAAITTPVAATTPATSAASRTPLAPRVISCACLGASSGYHRPTCPLRR